MKSLMLLWQLVLEDMGTRCRTSTTLDLKTVKRRSEHEGLSFLTITLPSFGKDFEKSLDQGSVDRSLFQGFTWTKGLPRFLGGFLDLVFDRCNGQLLDEPDTEAILAVRQLTLMFNKLLLPCSDEREAKAMSDYIKCENELKEATVDEADYLQFRRLSTLLWGPVLSVLDRNIRDGEMVPQHGPGATADRLRGNAKYRQTVWHERLERVFPVSDHLIPNYRYYQYLDLVSLVEPGAEMPVRVISVPKTLKTPRIIAVEPTCMQYMQQAISRPLVRALESSNREIPDYFGSWFIGFSDQVPNQELARKGSLTGDLATLDLSEASDRVSNSLVETMLRGWSHIAEAVQATRSLRASVPGHGVISISKFASMGSALCFPMEAMVFTTICFLGIQDGLNRPITKRDFTSFRDKVRVYGDDIIVPVEFVPFVVKRLESFNFRVNLNKSFWTGKFRESCGKEYYAGEDVSLVRVRRMLPTRRTDVMEIVSAVSLRNQFYLAGCWSAAAWLDKRIEGIIPWPSVAPTSPALGKWSFLGYDTEKFHQDYHSPLVRAMVVSVVLPKSNLDDYHALLKWFLKQGDLPFAEDHLERQGRPVSVDIKMRWASSF